jgi:hypothetical protein
MTDRLISVGWIGKAKDDRSIDTRPRPIHQLSQKRITQTRVGRSPSR